MAHALRLAALVRGNAKHHACQRLVFAKPEYADARG
jgi:hypothetical protein